MANINITRSYNDTELLSASDIDNIVDETKAFLNETKLNNDNIADGGIVGSTNFTIGSVSTSKFIDSNITTSLLADSPEGLSAAKINDSAVTTAKINDLAVTTAKINDLAVTQVKLAALTSSISSSSGSYTIPRDVTISDANYDVITNSLVYATKATRPLLFTVQGADQTSKIGFSSGLDQLFVALFRNETIISARRITDNASLSNLVFIDYASPDGTYGYTIRAYSLGATSSADISVINIKLAVVQL